MRKEHVSFAVIRRLPRYYRHLVELRMAGTERISSGALGDSMGLTASQIRQDLSCFGEFGQQGYGYNVENLQRQIGEILGMDWGHTAIVLGVGNLGRALMENFRFEWNGFKLEAAFDIAPELVGTTVAGVPVLHVDEMERFLTEQPADVAVLTVPANYAQRITDRVVAAGVHGVWNFTNEELAVPPEVVVESVHFADSLLTLSYMISEE